MLRIESVLIDTAAGIKPAAVEVYEVKITEDKVNVKKKVQNKKEKGSQIARWSMFAGIVLLFLCCLYYVDHNLVKNRMKEDTVTYVSGKVVTMLQNNTQKDDSVEGVLRGSQEIVVEILSGAHKGEQYMTTNYLSALYNTDAVPGTKLVLMLAQKQDGTMTVTVYGYDRSGVLYACIGIFALFLCFIGGKKGWMALISLCFSILCIWKLMFPMMLYGVPVLLAAILVVIFTTLLTFVLLDGITTKTVSATLGTLLGVIIAGGFAIAVGQAAHISGFQTNEAEELLLKGTDYGMKIKNLFVAGILIWALGAVMDVAMSIASSVHELHQVNPELNRIHLFQSGMNIGRDAMGTMANTLILAFAGSSLTLLLLVYIYQIPFIQLINTSMVAREVIQGIAGSIGIIITVPIVAFTSALIETRHGIK